MAKVFLSYRRDDSAGYAGRVEDRLLRDFGSEILFMDVDNIPIGKNFVKVLRDEVAKCEVLLAVIGPHWLDARDEYGKRRLDNPNDFVRIEIATALQRNITVIPIMLDGSKIPNSDQLPKELEELSFRNGLYVHHASFHNDLDRLVRELKKQLDVDASLTETKHQPLEEHQKRPGPEIATSVFVPVGNRVLPNEKERPRLASAALNSGLLAAVGAIAGFLIVAPFTVSSLNALGLAGVIAAIAGGLCGVAAGMLRARYGVLVAVHISSIAWGLIVFVDSLFRFYPRV
jgi:hypothetical protein